MRTTNGPDVRGSAFTTRVTLGAFLFLFFGLRVAADVDIAATSSIIMIVI